MKPTVFAGIFVTAVAALLFTAAPHASQSLQPPKWWASEPIRRELGITREQQRGLEEIFQAAVPTHKTLMKALDEEEARFGRLVEDLASEADVKAAVEQMHRVEASRAALKKAYAQMLIEMRRILTRDQWIRLGALQQAAEKERMSGKGK